jgi:hypothetical protein
MADYLTNIAARGLNLVPTVKPRVASPFEPLVHREATGTVWAEPSIRHVEAPATDSFGNPVLVSEPNAGFRGMLRWPETERGSRPAGARSAGSHKPPEPSARPATPGGVPLATGSQAGQSAQETPTQLAAHAESEVDRYSVGGTTWKRGNHGASRPTVLTEPQLGDPTGARPLEDVSLRIGGYDSGHAETPQLADRPKIAVSRQLHEGIAPAALSSLGEAGSPGMTAPGKVEVARNSEPVVSSRAERTGPSAADPVQFKGTVVAAHEELDTGPTRARATGAHSLGTLIGGRGTDAGAVDGPPRVSGSTPSLRRGRETEIDEARTLRGPSWLEEALDFGPRAVPEEPDRPVRVPRGRAVVASRERPPKGKAMEDAGLVPPESRPSELTREAFPRPRDVSGTSLSALPPLIDRRVPVEAAPSIRVTIGRVEVRAAPPSPPELVTPPVPNGPALSLDEYLERRNRGSW